MAYIIRNYDRIIGKALARIFFVLFLLFAVVIIVLPQFSETVAHALGIGRGADLIFYSTTISVLALGGLSAVKFRSTERRITSLARTIALKEFRDSEEKTE